MILSFGFLIAAVALAVLAAAPLFVGPYALGLLIGLTGYVTLASAWAMFSGRTGYVSLATVAFFGIGAYTVAVLSETLPYPLVLLVAAGIGLAVALLVGLAQAIPVGPIAYQIRTVMTEPLIKARIDPKQARRLIDTLEAIAEEFETDQGGAQEAVVHLLKLYFVSVWRMSGPAQRETQPPPRTIATHFLQSVELHLRDHWSVARYAAEIGVTSDRLNTTLRRTTGTAPLALIHARIIHEADAMLDHTSMQISEIAEDLGFSDPAYFSRFYKRLTGHSPNQTRRDVQAKAIRRSYAAWP